MTKRGKLLVLLGILAFALFNYPLVKIFNRDLCWIGIPVLIYYFFGAWLLAIVILAVGKRFLSS
jgi:energy-converting hydrogenase Eha subunit E